MAERLARGGTVLWLIFAIVLLPVLVIVLRLLFVLCALLWCRFVLNPSTYSYVSDQALHATTGDPPIRTTTAQKAQWPVPPIIHQTYKNDSIPPKWLAARESCVTMNPDYTHMFWTDSRARHFIAEHYAWFLADYDSYPYGIQRADAIRYFVLYHYGGVYMDLDIGCRHNLDGLREYDFVLPVTDPVGFSNDVIVGAPKHPFLRQVLHALPAWNKHFGTRYPTVMFSTGPMFLTLQYALYNGPAVPGRYALPQKLYSSHTEGSFFAHYSGSSWHGVDSAIAYWVYTHRVLAMSLGIGGATGVLGVLVGLCIRAQFQKPHVH